MALTPRLDLRQAQTLVMTPQLQQAIKLLQLSNIELSAFIEQELERNPLLERDEGETPVAMDEPPPSDLGLGMSEPDAPLVDVLPGHAEEVPLDVDVDNTFTSDGAADAGEYPADWSGRGGRSDFADDDQMLDNIVGPGVSLRDHVTAQINTDIADPAQRLIALHLLDMLDESGYLIGTLAEVADFLGASLADVSSVLDRVQRFDPPGLFARTLSECLALQLRDRNRLDPAMQALLNHLELLARRDINNLLKICGVDSDDLAEMINEIRALNPKPALAFDHDTAQPVTPDVLMRAAPGGGWFVELNSETLPRVLVNSRYLTRVSGSARSKDEKSYISEQLQSANWLVKALHQRATTILKVASELVQQQDGFFRHGISHLRPLVLRDIAEVISMHESTVSRVTANKYIATPRGIFELKYFFTQAIAGSDGGEAHSAESVRYRIKAMIDAEGKNVLSDDRIVEILKADGIDIARRTVAKYREGMKIPSSVQRRREKQFLL